MKKMENIDKNEDKNKKKKINVKLNKKLIIIISIGIIVLVGIFLGIKIYLINKPMDYNKEMERLGFLLLYDDDEKVSKLEALKICLSAVENSIFDYSDEDYSIRYAARKKHNIPQYITTENKYESITYVDMLIMLSGLYNEYTKQSYKYDANNNVDNNETYNLQEKMNINDMICNGVVSKDEDFTQELTKEKLNQVIITFVYNCNTLINYGSDEDTIQFEKSKYPSNYKEYPYILSNVDKKIYEIKPLHEDENGYTNPFDSYDNLRSRYGLIYKCVDNYFSNILNIDYQNIDLDNLYDNLSTFSQIDKEVLSEYVEYVKNNKIVIEGSAKAIMPIVYRTDKGIYVRAKLNYKINNSLTKQNVLFGDENINDYELGKKYEKIIDIMVSPIISECYIKEYNINNIIVK